MGPLTTDNWGHQVKYTVVKVCPRCSPVLCFIEGCDLPGTTVFEHYFGVGEGKGSFTVPNDICVCDKHAPMVHKYEQLDSRSVGAWVVYAVVVLALVIWMFYDWRPVVHIPILVLAAITLQLPLSFSAKKTKWRRENKLALKSEHITRLRTGEGDNIEEDEILGEMGVGDSPPRDDFFD
ncbi:MAG: hypothetical protein A2Y77_04330 [Planctomycetes bacterium RBG_13_62_9]|nr:MAG: hypothetical protein A2Y77_04330 [Planctomycetes bacterium RBG_13_62_9]